LPGDHVTNEDGTGFVHTAPGHGRDDFDIWTANEAKLKARGIETRIPFTVDENGAFTNEAPGFEGKRVITDKGEKGDANDAVIEALKAAGMLIARGKLKHQYPHSWRSKKPVIFRNTPQWFIAMDKDVTKKGDTLRQRALDGIKTVKWVPPQGENRITGMIEARPDWVISRQRAWGVPITVFVREQGDGGAEILQDEAVNKRIADAFEKEGTDAWYAPGARERFLGKLANESWQKVDDILDVWFDSGSTHSFTLEVREDLKARRKRDGGNDAVMYLEGSDQHRGWFHSSLLESCGTRGRPPYDVVLTHGFVLDEAGRKMSKSLGNVVAPQDVMKQSGADILRLWVAASDYADDLRIGPEILKTTVDTYRKLRNTLRWLLGSLHHFNEADRVSFEKMPELERLMLHELSELDADVRKNYAAFDYKRVFAALNVFMTSELSAFYFDVRKDALYCDPISSLTRKSCLTVLDRIFQCLATWLAPILAFTAEEVWLARFPEDKGSVHLQTFLDLPKEWRDEKLAEKWEKVRLVRRVVTGALEKKREEKLIGASLEAAPIVYVPDKQLFEIISSVDFAEVCITSGMQVLNEAPPEEAHRLTYQTSGLAAEIDKYKDSVIFSKAALDITAPGVVVKRAEGKKCARSWKISPLVGSDREYPDVTPRDAKALREFHAARRAAV
jgi:isoleucyl-tRNA synthetase